MSGVLPAVVGIAVIGWVLHQQLRTQEFTPRRARLAGVLGVIGLVQVGSAAAAHPASVVGWALLAVGLLVGAATGLLRAGTVALWVHDGRLYTRGHRGTAALWLVGIGAHVGLDLLARVIAPEAGAVNAASILLFVGVTLGAQALMTMHRARALRGVPAPVLQGVR